MTEHGIRIVPYSPLGRGLFGGKALVESLPANTSLESHPRFQGENFERNKLLYAQIEKLAKNMDAPFHNSHLHGFFTKVMTWHLFLGQLRLGILMITLDHSKVKLSNEKI
ncbi:Aldo/keto reductase/potassium channel subunit beta [Parasponia andersonii]|uniref:Aldo/keto reductase/potassium channel subunit beta n=1 Tax=Parasponia andersonii TaxID=3476 RepID=A0A2P5DKM6_PARAD|nr:Aldo/keto reductase/potassium channel subunit beta [Parasponia andersonii]